MTPGTPHEVPTSPIAVVGTIAVLLAFLVAGWCVAAGIAGNARKNPRLVRSAVYGLYCFGALTGLAAALIIYGFVTHDYSIRYVAATSDTSMSTWYKITSFWGGLDGSLLFWVVVLALFSGIAVRVNYKRHRDMIGYVVATIMAVQLFFLALLVFTKNPFATFLNQAPPDGRGLNPLLQNYWMIIHPPSLYIGFVAATIPFAFGIAALASGRLDDLWLGSVRTWMLICFFFLSFGLILGGRWAYEELGWGGYWAWDPVENAGFLPWFTATAFLHSAIIQEQRGQMKSWNLVLVILTFFLTIYGTFMTRSGVVQSVHAFGEDNELALQFIVFMIAILVVSFGLVLYRNNKLAKQSELESFISREYAFLLNNWILLGCAFFVLFATMFPTISEALDGERVSVGPEFFDRWMTPLGLVLLFLAGAAPLLAWRRTTRERLYNQFIVPLGVMAVTVIALAVFVPATRETTSVFAKGIELPIPLVTFGLIAFVFASIGQEFWRGARVRSRQTGSDPVTSLIGLVLSKRRKYGGYVVHLGIAVMFFGFTGRAWETMTDRTIEKAADVKLMSAGELPAAERGNWVKIGTAREERGSAVVVMDKMVRMDDPAWFDFGSYRFLYEKLESTHDDNKSAVTAKVSIWTGEWRVDRNQPPGKRRIWTSVEELATAWPARWDFHRGEQPTSEVWIKSRISEDIYVVLTGFDAQRGVANFRIYINPLINFVWAGFVLLGFGVFICLVPQTLVDRLQPKPRTRLGRAADIASVLALVGAMTFGSVTAALADEPGGGPVRVAQREGGAEHEEVVSVPRGHDDSVGWAHRFRPDGPATAHLMKELICLCGGCKRETLHDCKCGYAAKYREKVLTLMAAARARGLDDDRASAEVMNAFVKEFGGEVLATPRSQLTWLVPSIAAIGGLALLVVVGMRWVGRGSKKLAATPAVPEDENYAERLDDELRDTD
jgi:cytochrome c-type biogenesis protein CcmF